MHTLIKHHTHYTHIYTNTCTHRSFKCTHTFILISKHTNSTHRKKKRKGERGSRLGDTVIDGGGGGDHGGSGGGVKRDRL